jgi:hypothetical protein
MQSAQVRAGSCAWTAVVLRQYDGPGRRDMQVRRGDWASASGVPVIDHQLPARYVAYDVLVTRRPGCKFLHTYHFDEVVQGDMYIKVSNAAVSAKAELIGLPLTPLPDGECLFSPGSGAGTKDCAVRNA